MEKEGRKESGPALSQSGWMDVSQLTVFSKEVMCSDRFIYLFFK